MELTQQFQNLKKEGMPVTEYVKKMKTLTDNLAVIGEPVPPKKHIMQLLLGLRPYFNPIVSAINARADQPPLEEVYSLLLSHEFLLEKQNSSEHTNVLQANFTSLQKKFQKPFSGNSSSHFSPQNQQSKLSSPNFQANPHNQNFKPYNQFQFGILGKSQGKQIQPKWNYRNGQQNGNNRPQCQICGKVGHTALVWYHRTNLDYQPQSFNTMTTTNPFLHDSFTPRFASPPQGHNVMTRFQATPSTVSDQAWYMDSGATHHFTPDLTSISNHFPFHGSDQAMVSNSKKISICNIGFSSIPSTSHPLKLNNILHTPSISNRLISVNKLCSDNNVIVEFLPKSLFVKDLLTRKILLQGQLDHGLYRVPSFTPL
ncbi:hypothetical protein LWI28_003112 [Acer negundo]|uniref:Retrovirus-related Pol polyprotein from transposon TNT 1-94-like beta-barrel domain-containing protein n=1 Tax=Acer negundo TaxID=4023 RepID=A0AAD5NW80_ACENE|nr:hypothetical protein LWI28_003112 [Acer negundo]